MSTRNCERCYCLIWFILFLCACDPKQGFSPADIKPSISRPIQPILKQELPLPAQSPHSLATPIPVSITPLPSSSPTLSSSLLNGFRTNVRFSAPTQLRFDNDNILYVADSGHHAIRQILPNGQVLTLSGNGFPGFKDGPVSQAQFNNPTGLLFDKAGNLYIADTDNHAIRKLSKDGIVSTVVGKGSAGFKDGSLSEGLLNAPIGLTWAPDGALLIADTQNYRIRKLILGQSQSIQTFLYYPQRELAVLAQVSTEKLYAIGGGGFLEILSDGKYREMKLDLLIGLGYSRGITADHQGNIYLTNLHKYSRVLRIDKNGKAEDLVDFYFGPEYGHNYYPEKPIILHGPVGIAINSQGEIYVSEMWGNRIIKLIPKSEGVNHSLEIFAGK